MPTTAPPRFLNVDVDVESREPLDDLAAALPSMSVHLNARKGRKHYLSFAGPWFKNDPTPDQVMRRLTKAIEALDGEPRRLWQTASSRAFNLGFESGEDRGAAIFELPRTTVDAVSKLGASIVITLYPVATLPRKR